MSTDISARTKLYSPASNRNREGSDDGQDVLDRNLELIHLAACRGNLESITHDRFSPSEGVTSPSFDVFKPADGLLVRML